MRNFFKKSAGFAYFYVWIIICLTAEGHFHDGFREFARIFTFVFVNNRGHKTKQ